jgi:predicted nucleotidyltransferase
MTEKEMITKVVIETLAPLGVVRIAFFGSFVRQDFSPQSDIDPQYSHFECLKME